MSSFRRAEGWGPAEPTPESEDRPTSATIKQLTVGVRGPDREPTDRPDDSDTTEARHFAAERTPDSDRQDGGTEIVWASIRPEVLDSCSVALRRMGDYETTSIAVTSTSPREGRTTVAVGLAAAASIQLHRKTILLDLDLEHGAIQEMTSVGPGPGVIDFLYNEASIEDCLQPVDQLAAVVRAGLPRDSAGTMARMGRLTDLIEQLGHRCDVLIADLPPLSSGVTTARVADLFQSVTLVVRAGAVAVADIEETASVLTQRPFVILNGTAAPPSSLIHKIFGSRR
jgi:Mrp family chromosome partitioning ATPase